MAKINACLQGVINGAWKYVPKEEIAGIVKDVKSKVYRGKNLETLNKIQDEIKNYHDLVDKDKERDTLQAQLNAVRRARAQAQIGTTKDPVRKLVDFLIGNKSDSIGYRQLSYQQYFMGRFESELSIADLNTFQGANSDMDIAEW